MKRSIHRAACVAFVLLASILSGCQWKQLVVEIPDFDANLIEGVQIWRADEAQSPSFSELKRIVFLGSHVQNGTELIEYMLLDAQNQPAEYTYSAKMVRGAEGVGSATVHFVFPTWPHREGWIRVSSFNPIGESDLSDQAVFL